VGLESACRGNLREELTLAEECPQNGAAILAEDRPEPSELPERPHLPVREAVANAESAIDGLARRVVCAHPAEFRILRKLLEIAAGAEFAVAYLTTVVEGGERIVTQRSHRTDSTWHLAGAAGGVERIVDLERAGITGKRDFDLASFAAHGRSVPVFPG